MESLVVKGRIKAISPITHGTDTPDEGVVAKGNQIFHRKIKAIYQGEPVLIPVISGNSIRGLIRRLGANSFLNALGLDIREINQKLYYLLFSGGALEEKKKSGENEVSDEKLTYEELRNNIPLISLLGCSFGNRIVSGKLSVDMLVPYVDEIAEIYGLEKPNLRVSQIKDWLFYTRRDDFESDQKEDTNQMIYHMEYIVPGVEFIHGFTLSGANEIEKSLFVHLIEELFAYGKVGGKLNQGHGKVEFNYDLSEIHSKTTSSKYFDYIESRKDEIKEFLIKYWG